MKKSILCFANLVMIVALVAAVSSCSTSKKIADDELVLTTHCSGGEFQSNSKAFRYTGIGESMDQMTSKKKAMSEARAGLAASINTHVKAVTDNYVKSSNLNNKEELLQNYEGMNREVVNQTLSGVIVICEKVTKSNSTGNYKTYVCLELGSNEVLQSVTKRMSTDEQLKVDYNYEKYKKTFEEEMSKLGQ
jgi:hypothetical protein